MSPVLSVSTKIEIAASPAIVRSVVCIDFTRGFACIQMASKSSADNPAIVSRFCSIQAMAARLEHPARRL